jgi:hypothetical protein
MTVALMKVLLRIEPQPQQCPPTES